MKKNADPARLLLEWYDLHARSLPWRRLPTENEVGVAVDPYKIWLSEVMLQQTTVATVGPYFNKFMQRWPSVQALAQADLDEVLGAWAGLGYYARARNLHACAQAVTREHGGRFPDHPDALRSLPGIGEYTAAAIAAIAFDYPATVVDGNVERVITRLFTLETPLPKAKPEIRAQASQLTPAERPGDYAQAMMDLGATLCTPRAPNCTACPWQHLCAARKAGTQERFPHKTPKKQKPTRYGTAYLLQRSDGAVLMERRAEKGLLGGMLGLPGTDWREEPHDRAQITAAQPAPHDWQPAPETARHTFTHFHLRLAVHVARTRQGPEGLWILPTALAEKAVPTVMKKALRVGFEALGAPELALDRPPRGKRR
ncbi:MAG: A/G-specific adenine glycosylase [Neomegalonema sp.]|nr:A/G-specific adenine glycosylase [Neomegalonema sp.]